MEPFLGGTMDTGHFYFIKDQYFIDFPDSKLMKNKETVNGKAHNRPCFYAFLDKTTGLYWMIPFSSQVTKFQRIYDAKIEKFGRCDTIIFGEVLGHKKAFLIQNMCPINAAYIKNEYIDFISKKPVKVNKKLEKQLQQKASKVLALYKHGKKLIFPDVLKIEKILLQKVLE